MTSEIGGYPVVIMGTTMNFIQTRPRIIEGHWKEQVLLLHLPNLGKTAVLPVLPKTAPLVVVCNRNDAIAIISYCRLVHLQCNLTNLFIFSIKTERESELLECVKLYI